MDKIQELETKPIGHLLWQYALPAVITQVVASVYNIVDRVFLGQYVGALAIAGLAITLPIMNIIHALGSLVGVGASSRMSIVLGRKDIRWAEKILGNSMLLTFFFGFLFVAGGYLFMDRILELFGASPDTIAYARQYMQIILPGMFFTTLTFNLTGLIRASGYPTKSMWIMAGGAVLNIFLDALFIMVFGWGISGAAWASTLSMLATAVVAVLHFVSPSAFIRFHRHAWTPKLYIFRNILLIGLSPFLMNFAASFVVALLNRQLIRYGGDLAVGAYGIVNTYGAFLVMFILGLCQGMQPIAGYNYGAGHNHRLRHVYTLTLKVSLVVGTLGALLALVVPRIILRAFTDSDPLLDLGVPAMRYLNVMMPLIAFTITNSQFFQSIDKPWIAIVTSLSRQVLFLIPLMFVIPHFVVQRGGDGLTGVWVTCTICDVLGAVLAAALLWTQLKVFRPGYVPPVRRPRKEAGPDGVAGGVNDILDRFNGWVVAIILANVLYFGIRGIMGGISSFLLSPLIGSIIFVLTLIGIVSLVYILHEKKWAFYSWVGYRIVGAVVNSVIDTEHDVITHVIIAVINIMLMILVLQIKKKGVSAWSLVVRKKTNERPD